MCPEVDPHKVTVEGYYIYNGKKEMYQEKHSFTPTNEGTTISVGVLGIQHRNFESGLKITAECVTIIQPGSGAPMDCNAGSNNGFRDQEVYIYGSTGTCNNVFKTCELPKTTTTTITYPTVNINLHWECTRSFPSHC